MTEGPCCPGVGDPVYQPAGKAPGGTCNVSFACSPKRITAEWTEIEGIVMRTGVERPKYRVLGNVVGVGCIDADDAVG